MPNPNSFKDRFLKNFKDHIIPTIPVHKRKKIKFSAASYEANVTQRYDHNHTLKNQYKWKRKPYVKYWKIELIRIHDKVGQFQKDEEY